MAATSVLDLPEVSIGPRVSDYIASPKQMLIDGRWVDAASGKTFPVYNPATGGEVARVAEGDREDIERAVKAARTSFDNGAWRNMSPSQRGRIIWKIGDLILDNVEELAELEALDNGKPKGVAQVADVPLAADLFHYMAGWPQRSRATPFPSRYLTHPAPASMRIPCASRWASSGRSSRGISRS